MSLMHMYMMYAFMRMTPTSQKENVPPLLPVPYPKIYPIVVPKIINYANTSHFIIVFVDVVHV